MPPEEIKTDEEVKAEELAYKTHCVGVRNDLTIYIRTLEDLANKRRPSGAEVTLALRHLQDARMRLGVALAIEAGQDPWSSQVGD